MWGQGYLIPINSAEFRIIPTRVGTRKTTHTDTRTDEDHPHACGDKYIKISIDFLLSGSSPRVWGQDTAKWHKAPIQGIIPTRVGTRPCAEAGASEHRDHPHACGDKRDRRYDGTAEVGSSPRVWGQGGKQHGNKAAGGIIPTRVGTRKVYRKKGAPL